VPWAPGELDPEDDHHREVYAHYGLAMYCAQVLEHELANFVVVSRSIAGAFASHEEREALWAELFGSTMGRQLRHALAESRLDNDQVEALERALKARNFLAHDYFRERIGKLESERGRNEMIEELDEIRDTFIAADASVSPITRELMERGGVTREMIQAHVEQLRAAAASADH
jgi:hypothetical protein